MTTNCVSCYPNICMVILRKKCIYPFTQNMTKLHLQIIHSAFMVWPRILRNWTILKNLIKCFIHGTLKTKIYKKLMNQKLFLHQFWQKKHSVAWNKVLSMLLKKFSALKALRPMSQTEYLSSFVTSATYVNT